MIPTPLTSIPSKGSARELIVSLKISTSSVNLTQRVMFLLEVLGRISLPAFYNFQNPSVFLGSWLFAQIIPAFASLVTFPTVTLTCCLPLIGYTGPITHIIQNKLSISRSLIFPANFVYLCEVACKFQGLGQKHREGIILL